MYTLPCDNLQEKYQFQCKGPASHFGTPTVLQCNKWALGWQCFFCEQLLLRLFQGVELNEHGENCHDVLLRQYWDNQGLPKGLIQFSNPVYVNAIYGQPLHANLFSVLLLGLLCLIYTWPVPGALHHNSALHSISSFNSLALTLLLLVLQSLFLVFQKLVIRFFSWRSNLHFLLSSTLHFP